MKPSNRIIVNTLAQYGRTIINMVLSLYSSRLVLEYLGVDDYGIYALVAGVVSMLSFLTNSLVSSTQRFLSVHQGKGNIDKLRELFGNSLIIHIFAGLIISIVLACLTPFLFDGFLNIPESKTSVAKILYIQVVIMVYVSFITSPFRALLVSHENIVYTSIIDTIDGVLKVIFVLLLPLFANKLLTYGWLMFFIRIFDLLAFTIYCFFKYEECILPKFKYFNLSYLKELSSFTGWVMYSSGVIAVRTQGMAIVLNKMFGTVINAAYGIGGQIAGLISFVSSSFNAAIAPQLMASTGSGDRKRMWVLAEIECKFSFLLLAMLGIPTMFEMQSLLEIWLVDVPENTKMFGCMFLAMTIIDMLSSGLGTVNRALGKIGKYTLMTFTPKLLIFPICLLGLHFGMSLIWVCIIMVAVETLSMLLRIYYMRNISDFSAMAFCKSVIFRSLPPVIISGLVCWLIFYMIDFNLRFLLTYIIAIPIFILSTYFISLSEMEKNFVNNIVDRILNK
jgi:O-antigen/teichoic acid export membrane protein